MLPRSIKSLLLATAISLPAAAVFVAPSVSQAQTDSYNVPARDLATALKALADSAGVQVNFSASDVAGKTSTAVVNAPTLDDAVKTMLSGTGLTGTVAKDGTVTISGANKGGELVVTGRRYNLSSAKAQLLSSNLVTVMTAKELADHPDENVAESLARLPGISVLDGGYGNTNGVQVDEAGRGEGNFVTLRGMDAQYNVNLVNGVPVAEGMPYSREVQLNLLPPTGLQQIVVNKSLTADMQGDAIGGTIDFRTPTAFDFSGTTHASIAAGGQENDRASTYGLDGTGANVAVDFARKFGAADQVGVYVSGYYDEHHIANSIIDGIYPAQINGQWTYALQNTATGANAAPNPADNLTLEGVNAGLTQGSENRYGGAVSIDWRPNDTTSLYLRSSYGRDLFQQNTSYSQLYAQNYGTTPIGNGLSVPSITSIQPRFYYETNPSDAVLENLEGGGATQFGALHLSAVAFTSYGANNEPNHIETSARLPEFGTGFAFSGSSMFNYQNGAPVALLSTSELAQVGNVPNYGARRPAEETDEYSHQKKYGVKFDASYDVGESWLQTVMAGVSYVDSDRQHTERDYTENKYSQSNDPTFGGQGYLDGSVSAIVPGVYNFPIPLINQKLLRALFNSSLASNGGIEAISDQCGDNFAVNNDNCNTQRGTEAVTSVYAMGKLKFGDLEVLPGVRYEHTGITNTYWETPHAANGSDLPGFFTGDSSTYDKVLPSVQANYRPNQQVVYRASIYESYVKPSMFQLGGGEQYSVSQDTGAITITEGNPHLKAIDATNYDLSGEWTNNVGGAATAGVFYKTLDHFIYDSINGFTNNTATSNAQVTINTPENGGAGYVYGLELAGSQKFQDMPAPLNGIGVAGNFTYEQSSVNTGNPNLNPHERLLNQPNFAGNGELFYEKGPYSANLSVRYTGDYVAQYATIGGISALDTWVRANTRVDLHLGYVTPWGVHLTFAVANLLDANSYEATIGKTAWTIPDIVYSGRTYSFKASYSF